MGLDTYAEITATKPQASVDFDAPADLKIIHDWWNRHNLHQWFERLYFYKGGRGRPDPFRNYPSYRRLVGMAADDPVFNAVPMMFDEDDLDAFRSAMHGGWLRDSDAPSIEECVAHDEDFICKARQAMDDGKTIIIHSWY